MKSDYLVKVPDNVKPDGWGHGNQLKAGDAPVGLGYPGCQFRLPSSNYTDVSYAVNTTITGRMHYGPGTMRVRVKIEFVHDGEPSTFTRGWLYPVN